MQPTRPSKAEGGEGAGGARGPGASAAAAAWALSAAGEEGDEGGARRERRGRGAKRLLGEKETSGNSTPSLAHPIQLQYVQNSKARAESRSKLMFQHRFVTCFASRAQSHACITWPESRLQALVCSHVFYEPMNNQIACITCAESRLQAHVRSHVFCITCTVTCLHHV